jgi:methyl-accepting chemotaxis protein
MMNLLGKLKLSLKAKLLVYILVSFTIIYALSLGYVSFNLRSNAYNNSKEIIKTSTRENRNLIQNDLGKVLESTLTLRNIFNRYNNFDGKIRDAFYDDVLESWLENNKDFLSVWLVWELKAFNPAYNKKNGRIRNVRFRLNNVISTLKETVDTNNLELTSVYYKTRILNQPDIWNPYFDIVTKDLAGILMTSVSVPIQNNGAFMGLVGVDISLESMKNIVSEINPYEGSVSYLLSTDNSIVAHSDKNKIGKGFFKNFAADSIEFKTGIEKTHIRENYSFEYRNPENKQRYFVSMAPVIIGNISRTWTIGIEVPVNVIMRKANRIFYASILIGMLGLLLLYYIVYLIAGNIVRPINESVVFAESIARGNLNAQIKYNESDETGQLSSALSGMAEKLREIISEIIDSSEKIREASSSLSNSSMTLSQGATNQAVSAEEISSSMDEMVANIHQNSENALQTESIAKKSFQGIRKSHESTVTTVESMQQIAGKIEIVQEIARQTNILALNAAIEAARAGEQGKGFSVVANEVKKLAERSSAASVEIIELTNHALQLAQQSGHELDAIIPDIEKTAILVQEISSASFEQKTGADLVNKAIQELNSVTQQNSETSVVFTESAVSLTELAEKLRELVSYFESK